MAVPTSSSNTSLPPSLTPSESSKPVGAPLLPPTNTTVEMGSLQPQLADGGPVGNTSAALSSADMVGSPRNNGHSKAAPLTSMLVLPPLSSELAPTRGGYLQLPFAPLPPPLPLPSPATPLPLLSATEVQSSTATPAQAPAAAGHSLMIPSKTSNTAQSVHRSIFLHCHD